MDTQKAIGTGPRSALNRIAGGLCLLAFALFSISCAHTRPYVEPSIAAGELAVLEVSAPVWLVTLDGLDVSHNGWGDLKRLKLMPGAHVIEVSLAGTDRITKPWDGHPLTRARRISGQGNITIRFVATAGKTYVVGYETNEKLHKWRAFVSEFLPFDLSSPKNF